MKRILTVKCFCWILVVLILQILVTSVITEHRLVGKNSAWFIASTYFGTTERYISPPDYDLMVNIESLLPRPLPLVSAVVPCYNYGNRVVEAVHSLLQQTYPDLEVIVVDDGSTDNVTLEALQSLEGTNRVRVVRKSNGGLASARNYGTEVSRGEFIFYLDNDDKAEPLAIHLLLLKLIHSGPNVSYAYPEQWYEGDVNLVWRPQHFNHYDLLFTNHPTVCALVRKSAWKAVRGYDELMRKGMEDWEFWLVLAKNSHFGVRVSVPLFRYNRHGTTMVSETAKHSVEIRNGLIRSPRISGSYAVAAMGSIKKNWRPLISVIIPCYNPHLGWLSEALDSLKAQSIDDFEVILVDDASDQGRDEQQSLVMTGKVVDKYIRLEKRSLVSNARNRGALEAKGDYLFFLDADDAIHPLALEKLALAILNLNDHASKHISYVYPGVVHRGTLNATAYDVWNRQRLLKENFLTVTSLIKRDDFLQMGGFDANYDLWEDYDMWLRFLAYGKEGRLVKEPLFTYRRHKQGRSGINASMNTTELMISLKERNPQAYGMAPKAHLAQYRSLIDDKHDAIDDVVEKYARKYRANLQATVKYQEYRRPNTINPFQERFWKRGFSSNIENPVGASVPSSPSIPDVRIMYLMPFFNLGGAELVDLEILRALRNSDKFWITIVTELKTDRDVLRKEFEALAHEIFHLPTLVPDDHRAAERAIATVEYLMLSRRIDLVFNRNTFVGYRLAAVYKRLLNNTQVKFADLIHLYEPKYGAWERESTPYHSLLDRRFLISRDLRDHIHKFYQLPKTDFTVIYCGIDLERWSHDAVRGNVLRSRLNITDNFPIVGYNARLTAQKEPLLWVETARYVLKLRPRTRFVMIGDGELEADIRSAVRSGSDDLSKMFHMLGSIEHGALPDYIKDFDLLLFTSSFEGIPLAMMEAMALGVPVISPAIGGIPELVDDTTGTLVAAGSGAKVYANAVIDLLGEGPSNRIARKKLCIDRVKKKFGLQDMQDSYVDELWKLARKTDHDAMYRDALIRIMDFPLFELPPQYWKDKDRGNEKNKAADPGHSHGHGGLHGDGGTSKPISYTAVDKVVTWSGGIRLHSYSLEFSKTASGSAHMFRCFFLWVSPAEPPQESWVIFLHVRERDPKGRVLINADSIPNIKGSAAPTNTWAKDEIIEDEHYQEVSVREYTSSEGVDLYLVLGYYVVKDGKFSLIPLSDGSSEYVIRKFRWKDISVDI
jgi:glycosyltransferase involved in cell wall biosynthesis